MDILVNHSWPGNVRQLINALERSAITCRSNTIDVLDLPDYIFHEKRIERDDDRIERDKIGSVLSMYKGNRTLTAKHLGISRVTLWKRLKEFGID